MDNYFRKIINKATRKADHAQLNSYIIRSNNLKLMDNSIHTMSSMEQKAYILKVFLGKKMGVSYSNYPDSGLLDRALKMAKVTNSLDYFYGLPEDPKETDVKIYDSNTAEQSEDFFLETGEGILKDLKSPMIKVENADIVSTDTEFSAANSNGVEKTQKDTKFSINVSVSYKSKGKMFSHWDFNSARRIFDAQPMCKRLKETAEMSAKSRKLGTDADTLILSPKVLYYLCEYAMLPSFLGTNVESKHSTLTRKLGEQVFSRKLNLSNDGTLDWGFRSERFDYEGTPTRKIQLVEKGVVKNFLFDHNIGKFLGKESTGSAAKSGVIFNNIVLDIPKKKDIFSGVDKGVYVTSILGAHNSDPITTDFSVEADKGFYIENGHIKHPISNMSISSSMINLMNNIDRMGQPESIAGFYSGPIRFNNVSVKKS
ncbi:TldD/PmbA family protein [Candidatus Woesearchaeota archaeon]|nr:TldD/PmbA family protein [Candidatus Woesearchaeota archaeon]